MTDLNLILLGPPGAGKGTQSARLHDDFGLPCLSTGDILRRHRAEGTALGRQAASYMTRGRLVPDELVISMLLDELEAVGPEASSWTGSRERPRRRTHWIARSAPSGGG